MLVACGLICNSDSDAIGGQCYTRTAAPVMGLVLVNFRNVAGLHAQVAWRGRYQIRDALRRRNLTLTTAAEGDFVCLRSVINWWRGISKPSVCPLPLVERVDP